MCALPLSRGFLRTSLTTSMAASFHSNMGPTRVIVIAGPTAIGKSTLALSLCSQLGGEIVSADSVQVLLIPISRLKLLYFDL